MLSGASSPANSEGILVDLSSTDNSNKNHDDSGKDQTELSQGTQESEVQILKGMLYIYILLLYVPYFFITLTNCYHL